MHWRDHACAWHVLCIDRLVITPCVPGNPLELVDELTDVAKMLVDRCEPYVGDLVELSQLFHDEGPDVGRRDLLLRTVLERGLDAVGDSFNGRDADGPLLARLQQSLNELLTIETLAGAVLLHQYGIVDPFNW
jgi:hypothetical protein